MVTQQERYQACVETHCASYLFWRTQAILSRHLKLYKSARTLRSSDVPLLGAEPPKFRPMFIAAKWLDG